MNAHACLSDEDLGRLWEGDLPPEQRERFEQHLRTCSRCRGQWDQMVAGGKYVDSVLTRAEQRSPKTSCPSEDVLSNYLTDALDPEQKQTVEDHLRECMDCRDKTLTTWRLSEVHAEEGETWWAEYVGEQMLHFVAAVPEAFDEVLAACNAPAPSVIHLGPIIRLPAFEPAQLVRRRKAAATGEGFHEQVLHQDDPPFEFHIVQFGDQVKIKAIAEAPDSPYRDCLARLELMEGDRCRLSRVILVEKGQGECALGPDQTRAVRPDRTDMAVKLAPLVTLEQLGEAGGEAYVPILERYLRHDEPAIRRGAVEVLVRIGGPAARPLIEPLATDPDEEVRAAVRKGLDQMSLR